MAFVIRFTAPPWQIAQGLLLSPDRVLVSPGPSKKKVGSSQKVSIERNLEEEYRLTESTKPEVYISKAYSIKKAGASIGIVC